MHAHSSPRSNYQLPCANQLLLGNTLCAGQLRQGDRPPRTPPTRAPGQGRTRPLCVAMTPRPPPVAVQCLRWRRLPGPCPASCLGPAPITSMDTSCQARGSFKVLSSNHSTVRRTHTQWAKFRIDSAENGRVNTAPAHLLLQQGGVHEHGHFAEAICVLLIPRVLALQLQRADKRAERRMFMLSSNHAMGPRNAHEVPVRRCHIRVSMHASIFQTAQRVAIAHGAPASTSRRLNDPSPWQRTSRMKESCFFFSSLLRACVSFASAFSARAASANRAFSAWENHRRGMGTCPLPSPPTSIHTHRWREYTPTSMLQTRHRLPAQ